MKKVIRNTVGIIDCAEVEIVTKLKPVQSSPEGWLRFFQVRKQGSGYVNHAIMGDKAELNALSVGDTIKVKVRLTQKIYNNSSNMSIKMQILPTSTEVTGGFTISTSSLGDLNDSEFTTEVRCGKQKLYVAAYGLYKKN